jgi:hypothetical protein
MESMITAEERVAMETIEADEESVPWASFSHYFDPKDFEKIPEPNVFYYDGVF